MTLGTVTTMWAGSSLQAACSCSLRKAWCLSLLAGAPQGDLEVAGGPGRGDGGEQSVLSSTFGS